MIKLTRFNGATFYLNATHVETVESTPDTVITLFNDRKYIVKESADDVARRIQAFYQKVPPVAGTPHMPDDLHE